MAPDASRLSTSACPRGQQPVARTHVPTRVKHFTDQTRAALTFTLRNLPLYTQFALSVMGPHVLCPQGASRLHWVTHKMPLQVSDPEPQHTKAHPLAAVQLACARRAPVRGPPTRPSRCLHLPRARMLHYLCCHCHAALRRPWRGSDKGTCPGQCSMLTPPQPMKGHEGFLYLITVIRRFDAEPHGQKVLEVPCRSGQEVPCC